MSKEAMKLALEALDWISRVNAMDYEYQQKAKTAITAIKQALSAPVQEPVASAAYDMIDRFLRNNLSRDDDYAEYSAALDVIYTTPPAAQRTWVWLTDEDIEQEFGFIDELLRDCVHRTEAKVREKNNG
jgi:hypothetical protein